MKRINKFYLIGLKMEGFKRFKEPYEVRFDRVTYISGANGQGKSSIADAIAYAFCGAPFWGERSCDRLQNPDCKEMSVEVQFADEDGELHNILRRRNGAGSAVTYDGVPIRQADVVNIFAEKDIFLSLLNPLYFIEKLADSGRAFLQKLLPPVDDEKVREKLSESTKALLDGESLSSPEYYISQKREEIREIDKTLQYLEGQTDMLKTQRMEAEIRLDSVLERGNKLVERKNALEERQFAGIDVDKLKCQAESSASSSRKAELIAKRAEIQARQYDSRYAAELASTRSEIAELSKQYKRLIERGKSIKPGDKCPMCFTLVTEQNYRTVIDGIKKELSEIKSKGVVAQKAYKELETMDRESRAKFDEFKADDLKKAEEELNAIDNNGDTAALEQKLRLGNLSEEEYSELCELRKQADAYSREVELLCETDKIPAKLEELQKAVKENTERRKELQKLISAAGEFSAKRAELTLEALRMNHAAIKLYDVVKTTGEVKDVFRFTYDGRDYRWLSTSEKIKAGLEVSKLLAQLTGLVYPTYIDNAECMTSNPDSLYGQVMFAFARKTPLSVQYPLRKGNNTSNSLKEAA